MRRIATVIFALLAVSALFAETPGPEQAYFCTSAGTRLHYQRVDADDGALRWNHVMTIESVSADGVIEYNSNFTRPGGGKMYRGPVSLEVKVGPDGDVEMDVANSVASVVANIVGERRVKSEGVMTVLPSDMAPGDVLPDASGTVTAGFASLNVCVSDRKVLKTETVTTPAGSFDCIVVREHKVEKGSLRNRVTTALTWYARGVGMVRHDTYDKNMKLETSEFLVRMEHK